MYSYAKYVELEEIYKFEAHEDGICSLAAHPSKPYLLSLCHDDIKLWNMTKGLPVFTRQFFRLEEWQLQLTFDPKDGNQFASLGEGREIKVI